MPDSALSVQNARITTATVEIQTLTISGKQVTLAVFRQLLKRPLFDPHGRLYGTPWGTVNYHVDVITEEYGTVKCDRPDAAVHLHVVWQLGHELRRSLVTKPRRSFLAFRDREEIAAEERDYESRCETWAALNKLPQLFIAV